MCSLCNEGPALAPLFYRRESETLWQGTPDPGYAGLETRCPKYRTCEGELAMLELEDITQGTSKIPRGLETLTQALRGLVAVTPLPSLQALGAGLLPGRQLEALVAVVHGSGSHRVLLAKDNAVLWGSGNSAGESWEGGGGQKKHIREISQLTILSRLCGK